MGVIYLISKTQINNETTELTAEIARARSNEIAEFIRARIDDVEYLSLNDDIRSLKKEAAIAELNKFLSQKSHIYDIMFYADLDGITHINTGQIANISQRDYFQYIVTNRRGDYFISNPMVSQATGRAVFVIAHAIKDDSNKVIGLIAGSVEAKNLSSMVDDMKIGESGAPCLVDGTGLTVYHQNLEYIMKFDLLKSNELGFRGLEEAAREMIVGESSVKQFQRPDGNKMIIVFNPIKHTPNWSFVVMIANTQFNKISNNILKLLIIILLIMIVTTIFISIGISNMISKPIIKISSIIEQISKNDLRVKENAETDKLLKRKDEIGDITNALKDMQLNLIDMVKSIKESSESINNASNDLAATAEESSATGEELSSGSESITKNVEDSNISIENTTSGVQEVSASAQSIAKLAQDLNENATEAFNASNQGVKGIKEIVNAAIEAVRTLNIRQ
jgi:methyl-accepting chemotaxis protein